MSYFKLVAKSPRFGFNICKNMVLLWYLLSFNLTDENTGNHQYKLVETSVWRQAALTVVTHLTGYKQKPLFCYTPLTLWWAGIWTDHLAGWLDGWTDRTRVHPALANYPILPSILFYTISAFTPLPSPCFHSKHILKCNRAFYDVTAINLLGSAAPCLVLLYVQVYIT